MELVVLNGLSEKEAAFLNRFHRCGDSIKPVNDSDEQPLYDNEEIPDTSVQEILRGIFTVDKDGNKSGDLSLYYGQNIRPELRDFIERNLLRVQNPIKNFGLSDEDLFALTPVMGELSRGRKRLHYAA